MTEHIDIESLPFDKLVKLLEDEEKWVRIDAVIELEARRETRAVQHLLALLSREEKVARPRIIEALGNLKGKEAVEPLIELLEKERHIEILLEIPMALAKIGDDKAVEPLKTALSREEPSLVAEAVKALYFFRVGDVTSQLESLLEELKITPMDEDDETAPARSALRHVIERALPHFRKF